MMHWFRSWHHEHVLNYGSTQIDWLNMCRFAWRSSPFTNSTCFPILSAFSWLSCWSPKEQDYQQLIQLSVFNSLNGKEERSIFPQREPYGFLHVLLIKGVPGTRVGSLHGGSGCCFSCSIWWNLTAGEFTFPLSIWGLWHNLWICNIHFIYNIYIQYICDYIVYNMCAILFVNVVLRKTVIVAKYVVNWLTGILKIWRVTFSKVQP